MGLVLLVEDDEDMREAVADVLAHAGYRVAAAADGQAALDVLRTQPEAPRLALVDMCMPVMNGPELVAQLRSDYAAVPVVMLSAAPPRDMAIEGVAATVQKPVSREALLAAISDTLRACEGPR